MEREPRQADDANAHQLRVLRDISDVLRDAHIRFWLRGGWALDFQLGRITRTHSDIDLVTWLRHRRRIHRLLNQRGFVDRSVPAPEVQLLFVRDGVEINFALVERHGSGSLVSRGLERWPWPEGTVSDREHELHGVRCRPMTPQALLADMEYHRHRRGRRPRKKDVQTVRLLRQLAERP